MKVVTIIGARPQFIKAATVSRQVALRDDITEVIVHTGQHYDANMSDIFFDELGIPRPDHHLGIGGGSHGAMTGRQLEAIEKVLLDEKPDRVLVYGDTNSTLAGALAAVKLHIPVVHVEAGLRSFNRQMPEEINRILTDHAADLLFAPTQTAMANLRNEGLPDERLHLVGDVMYDASLFYRDRARQPEWFAGLAAVEDDYVLATIHRAENTDDRDRLAGILAGLGAASRPVILPLHPRTRSKIADYGLVMPDSIHIVAPVGYLEMVWLESNAAIIATDSGGVQKEAYFYGKPCVTLRDETEWVELVEAGWNVLVGADATKISGAVGTAKAPARAFALYGTGGAATKVVEGVMK
jgi:UDP-GlcNAc3NAcA epimerase